MGISKLLCSGVLGNIALLWKVWVCQNWNYSLQCAEFSEIWVETGFSGLGRTPAKNQR